MLRFGREHLGRQAWKVGRHPIRPRRRAPGAARRERPTQDDEAGVHEPILATQTGVQPNV